MSEKRKLSSKTTPTWERSECRVDPAQVVAVDQHGAAVGLVEARDQQRRGGLAAAARADDRHPLPRLHVEVEAVEDAAALVVAEADRVEVDLAAQRRQLDRVGGVGDRRGEVEQLEDPLDPGARLLADRQQSGELAGRRDQLADVGGEGEEGAEADLAAQRQPAAEGEDRHLAEGRDRLQQRLEARGQPDGAHLRAVEVFGGGGDPLQLAVLLAERLHHADAVDRLVDDLDHLAFALLGVPGGGEDLASASGS